MNFKSIKGTLCEIYWHHIVKWNKINPFISKHDGELIIMLIQSKCEMSFLETIFGLLVLLSSMAELL